MRFVSGFDTCVVTSVTTLAVPVVVNAVPTDTTQRRQSSNSLPAVLVSVSVKATVADAHAGPGVLLCWSIPNTGSFGQCLESFALAKAAGGQYTGAFQNTTFCFSNILNGAGLRAALHTEPKIVSALHALPSTFEDAMAPLFEGSLPSGARIIVAYAPSAGPGEFQDTFSFIASTEGYGGLCMRKCVNA